MKSILIAEHPHHIHLLRGKFKKGDVFIGLTPPASYELQRSNFPYKTPKDYYSHSDFFSIYQECTSNLIDIIIMLDSILWDVDARLKQISLSPFFLGIYQFKILIDTLKTYIYILTRVIRHEVPDEVVAVSGGYRHKNEGIIYLRTDPVCALVAAKVAESYRIKFRGIENRGGLNHASNSFITRSEQRFIKDLKYIARYNLATAWAHGKKNTSNAKKILAINCKELAVLKSQLSDRGYRIDTLEEIDFTGIASKRPYLFYENFLNAIRINKAIKSLCIFESVNFYDIIGEKIGHYCRKIENFIELYNYIHDVIEQKGYDAVVLGFLTSPHLVSVMASDICRKNRIPCIGWMHGAYGAYQSIEGYDMSDLLFVDYYFTYGTAVNSAVALHHPAFTIGASNEKKLALRYDIGKRMLYASGSPYLENMYRHYKRPDNSKKVITFVMGEYWEHNQYYMGGNSPYTFFQKWDAVQKVINVLLPFQIQYRILIKAYPFDTVASSLLAKYLRDNEGVSVEIIHAKMPFCELLKITDVLISTWVSTTFFESTFVDCDQFLFDDGDLTEEVRRIIAEMCFFSDDINAFCQMLYNYLQEGIFYQKTDKMEFRTKFLDSMRMGQRVEHIDNLIQNILQHRSAVNVT